MPEQYSEQPNVTSQNNMAAIKQLVNETNMHRRKVAFASMRSKILSAQTMLATALELAHTCEDEIANQPTAIEAMTASFCHNEAIYAAVDEAVKTLELVQILSVKLSGIKPIPQLERYAKAIENGGPPPRTIGC